MGRGQAEIYGSRLVVHCVAFPARVRYISRQGVICSLQSCVVQALCRVLGYEGEMGGVSSVVLHPAILLDKGIDHFLHGQVWDQLILGQGAPGDWVKMTNSLHRWK